MMQTCIEFSQYAEMESPRKEDFSFEFTINECDRETSKNLQPNLKLGWKVPEANAGKIIVSNNRITRVQGLLFDDSHKQCTGVYSLPNNEVHRLRFRIISYGASDSPDSIYFGIATKTQQEKALVNGRERESLAYWSCPGGFN